MANPKILLRLTTSGKILTVKLQRGYEDGVDPFGVIFSSFIDCGQDLLPEFIYLIGSPAKDPKDGAGGHDYPDQFAPHADCLGPLQSFQAPAGLDQPSSEADIPLHG